MALRGSLTHGSVAPGFESVGAAFLRNIEEGLDQGAAFAALLDGVPVVDLWGGFADAAGTRPWERTTLANVQSVSKSVVALAIALLVDRDQLDYEAPIADVWPAFGAAGKEAITLGQLLSHQAGLNTVRERLELRDLYEDDRFVMLLAAMAPLYPPGERCIYHALSFGHLAAEIVRRVDGRPIGRFVAEEIAAPLGAELFLGLPGEQDHRAAEIIPGPGVDDIMEEASRGGPGAGYANPRVRPDEPNTRAWRAAGVPAGGVHADALSLARVYAALASRGSLEGRRLIGERTLALATCERFCGKEGGFGWPSRFGAGFMLNLNGIFGPSPEAFGHNGWGGYFAFADPERRLAVAFVMNRMLGPGPAFEARRRRLLGSLFTCLDRP